MSLHLPMTYNLFSSKGNIKFLEKKKKTISKTILQSTIESCKKNFHKKAIGMLSQRVMHKL